MKFRIDFWGTPVGGLNSAYKQHIVRVVEASDEDAAKLRAYEKHEHIGGGTASVRCEQVSDDTKVTEPQKIDETHKWSWEAFKR